MLVVKVELHSAITKKVTPIAQMIIANVGGTKTRGDYTVKVAHQKDIDDFQKVWTEPQRTGSVTNYPRLSYHVWRLVLRALKSAYPEEKG